MKPTHLTDPKPKCRLCIGTLLLSLIALVLAASWVVMVIEKVFAGAGMEHCCTIEGVRFNYLGIFVLLCGLGVAVLFALIMQIRDWRVRKEFEQQYGLKIPAERREPMSGSGIERGASLHGIDYDDDS